MGTNMNAEVTTVAALVCIASIFFCGRWLSFLTDRAVARIKYDRDVRVAEIEAETERKAIAMGFNPYAGEDETGGGE